MIKGQKTGNPAKTPAAFAEIYPAFFTWMKLPDGTYLPRLEELPEMMTVPAAAKFLKVSDSTVKWLCDQGHLTCQRATPREHSKRLISKAAIVRYNTQRRESEANRDAA